MKLTYKEAQRNELTKLVRDKSPIFCGDQGGKYFMGSTREFVLTEGAKNIFLSIRNEAIDYFKRNKVSWWGGVTPTGNILSSQIACVNHLFHLRNDKTAVLSILQIISNDFVDVFEIETDKSYRGYIQFESVSDYDYLYEGRPGYSGNADPPYRSY